MSAPGCSSCGESLELQLVDLGTSPLANALVPLETPAGGERRYPLVAWVCGRCFLVQVPPVERPETVFDDVYPYFSSISAAWRAHTERYAAEMLDLLGLDADSRVVELASNDGCLLEPFLKRGVRVQGIDPAGAPARAARERGVPTLERFFGRELAAELIARGDRPDLLVANNVLAHVPDLDDFMGGVKDLLKPDGVVTMEFPHVLRMIEDTLFDTIYHEHLSYFSLGAVARVFAVHGLTLFDVRELPTHGGSLRVFARHADRGETVQETVRAMSEKESRHGLDTLDGYAGFQKRAEAARRALREFLEDARARGKIVAGYGAPAKATTLLNYCGVGPDLLAYTVDRNQNKQNRLVPGARIPIREPEVIAETRPDYLLILPWNLREEIVAEMSAIREWGGRFVIALPGLEVFDGP
jgi:SAM-dependent methyltransferase